MTRSCWAACCVTLGYVLLAACATHAPPPRDGLSGRFVRGQSYLHAVYRNAAFLAQAGEQADAHVQRFSVVHVYIDGDGLPWLDRWHVADDPTPANPLVFGLLQADAAPAIYLGRPCHFTIGVDVACEPRVWTAGRYSAAVLASLDAALGRVRRGAAVVLIGHSGGGALAMLLAARSANVVGVVTVAGNLDVAGWTRLHDYSRLATSIDPAAEPALPRRIQQLHLAGGADRDVPPALVRSGVARQAGAQVRVVDGFDHLCCWQRIWPQVLDEIGRWQ